MSATEKVRKKNITYNTPILDTEGDFRERTLKGPYMVYSIQSTYHTITVYSTHCPLSILHRLFGIQCKWYKVFTMCKYPV